MDLGKENIFCCFFKEGMKDAKQINIFWYFWMKGCNGCELLLEMNFNGYHSFLNIFGEFNALIS